MTHAPTSDPMPLDVPATWDDAASDALGDIFAGEPARQVSLEGLAAELGAFIDSTFGVSDTPATVVRVSWEVIGATSIALAPELTGTPLTLDECHALLVRKQLDYGSGNILRFSAPGMPGGLLVRCWDKVARLQNLTERGTAPENESLRDSLLDLTNYAAIGLMVEAGHFTLPLAVDLGR